MQEVYALNGLNKIQDILIYSIVE